MLHLQVESSEHNFDKKQDSSIAYANPWMFCLDTDGQHPVLQVARHFRFFTELSGMKFNLNVLSLAISSQISRRRVSGRQLAEPIEAEKIEKFGIDKLEREKSEQRRRLKILKECALTLQSLTVLKAPNSETPCE